MSAILQFVCLHASFKLNLTLKSNILQYVRLRAWFKLNLPLKSTILQNGDLGASFKFVLTNIKIWIGVFSHFKIWPPAH